MEVRGRHYLLLPKLNGEQLRVIGAHLAKKGFRMKSGSSLTATSSVGVIHVEPAGLCWSSSDPSDYLLPLIPEVLGCKKETVGAEEVLGMYYVAFPGGRRPVVRITPRLESLGNWDRLRSAGECGLAPDEHLLVRQLLCGSKGACSMITDFAIDGSSPFRSGRRLLFRSMLSASRACESLRVVGGRKQSNAYLPRNGVLPLSGFSFRYNELARRLEELGEWCSFAPARRESSNWRLDRPCPAPVV